MSGLKPPTYKYPYEDPNMTAMTSTELHTLSNSHLDALEEETIFILREVAAAFERHPAVFGGQGLAGHAQVRRKSLRWQNKPLR